MHQEITNIKQSLDEGRYQLRELSPLYIDSDALRENRLQAFINCVVRYAELKAKLQEQSQVSLDVSSQIAMSDNTALILDTQSNASS